MNKCITSVISSRILIQNLTGRQYKSYKGLLPPSVRVHTAHHHATYLFPALQRFFSTNNVDSTTPSDDAEAAKRAAEARLSLSGMGIVNDEEFKVTEIGYKSGRMSTINLPPAAILKRTNILPRDLVSLHLTSRQKHSTYTTTGKRPTSTTRPATAISPRTDCILLSFGNVRAVAGRDSVYIFDTHSEVATAFAMDLSAFFRTDCSGDPPEFLFLEAVLRDTVDTYTTRIRIFEPIVDNLLNRVASEVFSDSGVHQLVPLKDSLQSFELQVKQSLDCLTSILNDDDLMLALLLTEQAEARSAGVKVDFQRHEHVELMLSVYSRQIQSLLQEIQYLLGRIQSKQEFVSLAMAGYRNRLMTINVNIGIMGVSLGILTATTGLFGMNLINGLEEAPGAFAIVTGSSATLAATVASVYFSYIRGGYMQARAEKSQAEIETFAGALSDMSALDYTVRTMIRQRGSFDKESFRSSLTQARESQRTTEAEVDFLFHILDSTKDNYLSEDDFLPTAGKGRC